MTTLQDFVYLLLYVAIFMVSVTVLFLMLGTSKTKDATVSEELSDKTSISMSTFDEEKGYGRNNVMGADKVYTKKQQQDNMVTISGEDVYLDIIAEVESFTDEEMERYKDGEIQITVRSQPISYQSVVKLMNKNDLVVKNLKSITLGSNFQRVYKYDQDLNLIAINYQ